MRRVSSALAMVMLLSAGSALAGPTKGQFSVRLMAGADLPVGGALHNGASVPVANLGTLNPALNGVSGTLDVQQRGWQRFIDGGFAGNVELGYGLSDNSEVFGALRYQEAGRGGNQVGVVQVPALNAALPITGVFTSGEAWSGEIGYRRYFGSVIKPYVAARAGVTFTDSLSADLAVPAAAIALNGVPFYRSSVSATGGVDLGVAIPLAKTVDFNIETGIRYTTGLRGDDAALAGLGLGALNDAGARWDVPARAGLTFRF